MERVEIKWNGMKIDEYRILFHCLYLKNNIGMKWKRME
jgi:hypothetical protein